mmetsp:Transcript_3768/g.9477  ORF Transcript_3768/g.9477 Transcript_3768/m.9477 type:complete len:207 (-) Transcript_3768:184-804(-)
MGSYFVKNLCVCVKGRCVGREGSIADALSHRANSEHEEDIRVADTGAVVNGGVARGLGNVEKTEPWPHPALDQHRLCSGLAREGPRRVGHVVGQVVPEVERLVELGALKRRDRLGGRSKVLVRCQLAGVLESEPSPRRHGSNCAVRQLVVRAVRNDRALVIDDAHHSGNPLLLLDGGGDDGVPTVLCVNLTHRHRLFGQVDRGLIL